MNTILKIVKKEKKNKAEVKKRYIAAIMKKNNKIL